MDFQLASKNLEGLALFALQAVCRATISAAILLSL